MNANISAILPMPKNETASVDEPVDGIVCPACYKPLKNKLVYGPGEHPDGFGLRHYYGHCYQCRTSCEVIQFEQDGKWLMHQLRQFRIGGQAGAFVTVMPLPVNDGGLTMDDGRSEPVVKTGPGGDFVRTLTDEQLKGMLVKATETLNKLGHVVAELLGLIRERKNT